MKWEEILGNKENLRLIYGGYLAYVYKFSYRDGDKYTYVVHIWDEVLHEEVYFSMDIDYLDINDAKKSAEDFIQMQVDIQNRRDYELV